MACLHRVQGLLVQIFGQGGVSLQCQGCIRLQHWAATLTLLTSSKAEGKQASERLGWQRPARPHTRSPTETTT